MAGEVPSRGEVPKSAPRAGLEQAKESEKDRILKMSDDEILHTLEAYKYEGLALLEDFGNSDPDDLQAWIENLEGDFGIGVGRGVLEYYVINRFYNEHIGELYDHGLQGKAFEESWMRLKDLFHAALDFTRADEGLAERQEVKIDSGKVMDYQGGLYGAVEVRPAKRETIVRYAFIDVLGQLLYSEALINGINDFRKKQRADQEEADADSADDILGDLEDA